MPIKNSNHKYLISLYSRVDDFLANEDIQKDELPDSIVSFCIVVEKILKIKLYTKNPFLVFEASGIKEGTLSIIALKKEIDIRTANIGDIIDRFKIVFKKIFSPDELQALLDIYEVRNCFVHGHKSDEKIDFDIEDIVKKMGTVWEKISKIAISLFGKESIKNGRPKKKYTEKELEKALEDEVKKMIQPLPSLAFRNDSVTSPIRFASSTEEEYLVTRPYAFGANGGTTVGTFAMSGEKCPRCHFYSLVLDNGKSEWTYLNMFSGAGGGGGDVLGGHSNLYKCKRCHLELTEKQYEIAKKIDIDPLLG